MAIKHHGHVRHIGGNLYYLTFVCGWTNDTPILVLIIHETFILVSYLFDTSVYMVVEK